MITSADSFRGQAHSRRLLDAYFAKGKLVGTILLLGQRGLGKTTLASIIARALTCERNVDAPRLWFCGECYACRSIAQGEQPEYVVVRPRGQDISVGQIDDDHDGFHSALLHPTLMSHRVFVIDDAHHLNEETGNRLLKLFEEAPERTVFILTTDKPELLLPTIHSRGQKINLKPEPQETLAEIVQADAQVSAIAAQEAARMAAGRYVEAMALARDDEWRKAVKRMAGALTAVEDVLEMAKELSGIEFDVLWAKALRDRGLTQEEADKMIGRAKSDDEKGLRVRRNELHRQALVNAYDRAAWWMLGSTTPVDGFADALNTLKARINQNVDPVLAQTAFELTIAEEG